MHSEGRIVDGGMPAHARARDVNRKSRRQACIWMLLRSKMTLKSPRVAARKRTRRGIHIF